MTTTPDLAALQGKASVALPLERAFAFFTESFGKWWPSAYHIGTAEMADAILEPQVGGRWFERGVDGSECDWGRVLVWEPPHRLVLTWQINGHWQFDPDPARASEIEVRFTAESPEQTTVTLEHRHIDRLVEGRAMAQTIVEGGGGWSTVLEAFAKTAEGQG
ncbi:SRPBCC family protein [Nocardia sp. NPDC127579]|uniref:SRPBCC family protein n=1 Tax=Nocardia sp. NPDC127579 TaxID=3345402 RepID=UPI00362525ED